MKNTELLKIINHLLNPEADLGFLLGPQEEHLETLIASIRDRIN
ncbi:MAG: hypothetical protein AB2L12_01625 [Smithellaceae bacterium]